LNVRRRGEIKLRPKPWKFRKACRNVLKKDQKWGRAATGGQRSRQKIWIQAIVMGDWGEKEPQVEGDQAYIRQKKSYGVFKLDGG